MKTGIIILNYNDYENTIKMIEQIKDYKCLNKIVVVDNCSKDESVTKLKPYETKKVILLTSKENLGYAHGNNLGLKYLEKETDCELAIISNPDIVVEESVIKELIQDMKKNSNISFLGPKVLERGRISKGWKLPTYWVEVLSTINFFSRFTYHLSKYADNHYNERLVKVDVVHGCFFLARMKDFKKIKYFDENTFLYYEENIIAAKSKKAGLETYLDTTVGVQHALSQTIDKSIKKVAKYKIMKQSMFYFEKEYNNLKGIKLLLLKIIYQLSLIATYLTFWI